MNIEFIVIRNFSDNINSTDLLVVPVDNLLTFDQGENVFKLQFARLVKPFNTLSETYFEGIMKRNVHLT